MVDYFKAYIKYSNPTKIKELANNGTFAVATSETDTTTAEVTKETYLFKNMVIEPHHRGVLLYGSLHKLRSQIQNIATPEQVAKHGGFNGDLFTLDEVTQTINALCGVLDVCPSVCELQNIEIGVNNPVNFDPKTFLEGILYHRHHYDYEVKHKGNYVQFSHAQYYLKLYNKGRQFQLPQEVIRVEIKVRKMQKLHNAGVQLYTLEDINELTLLQSFDILYKEFEELVYFDRTTRTHDLNDKDQAKAVQFQNKDFWKDLSRTQRNRYKEQLQKMIVNFSDNLKGQIQEKMQEVLGQILGSENGKNVHKFTNPKSDKMCTNLPTSSGTKNVHKFTDPKSDKMCTNLPTSEKGQMCTNLHFKYRVNLSQTAQSENEEKEGAKTLEKNTQKIGFAKVKKCPVTGLELHHEKEGAKYVRTNTFLWLRANDPNRYILLCSELLPSTGCQPAREKNIISHLCKQVRNLYRKLNNQPNKPPLQKYFKNQLELL